MRPSRKPRFVVIFLLVLCAVFIYGYTARMGELAGLQVELVAIQARVGDANQDRKKLESERAYVASADYLDRTAREDFDFGKAGDRLVVPIQALDGASGTASSGMAVPAGAAVNAAAVVFDPHDLPVWQQWVTFFADGRARAAR